MRKPARNLLYITLLAVAEMCAQPAPQSTSPNGDGPLTRSSFNAKGLQHEEDLTDLFTGNFGSVSFDRGSLAFNVLFETYLKSYWNRCSASLPTNKVEMTVQVCDEGPSSPPLPGQPPPPSHPCMPWKTLSLGWADPALWAAKKQLDAEQSVNMIRNVFGQLNNVKGMIADGPGLTMDVDRMVGLNACNGAGLRRFQENMVLFAKGRSPIVLPGTPAPGSNVLSAGALADSDFNQLLEDLVVDQARAWMMNRLVPGSISRILVAHEPTGSPSKIMARYIFTSPMKSGRNEGSVTVSFTGGMPQCIYFSDAPSSCQTPNRRIVAKYASGGYRDPNAGPPVPLPPSRDPAVQEKARVEASAQGNICVPDDLLAEWRNPPPGGKMEALKTQLKASLRERATLRGYDQTKWMTVSSRFYPAWNPAGPFRNVVTATDGGSCAVGHHEILPLTP